jgi:hypothetical protein
LGQYSPELEEDMRTLSAYLKTLIEMVEINVAERTGITFAPGLLSVPTNNGPESYSW